MRNNLPITHIEYEFGDDISIVSKTDTKGGIIYVNPSFITVSGFSEEELIGQPHNIVRHPDMPAEAFADQTKRLLQAVSVFKLTRRQRHRQNDYKRPQAEMPVPVELARMVA